MAALGGQARIMIGPRSAIYALDGLGLIVVDEEHDPAYKQEEGIRYNARDLAVMLGRLAPCPVVLGSATPSSESFHNARRGRYRLLRMARRVMERPLAEVEIVDLRAEFKKDPARDKNGAGTGGAKKLDEPRAQRLRRRCSTRSVPILPPAGRVWCFSTAAATSRIPCASLRLRLVRPELHRLARPSIARRTASSAISAAITPSRRSMS